MGGRCCHTLPPSSLLSIFPDRWRHMRGVAKVNRLTTPRPALEDSAWCVTGDERVGAIVVAWVLTSADSLFACATASGRLTFLIWLLLFPFASARWPSPSAAEAAGAGFCTIPPCTDPCAGRLTGTLLKKVSLADVAGALYARSCDEVVFAAGSAGDASFFCGNFAKAADFWSLPRE